MRVAKARARRGRLRGRIERVSEARAAVQPANPPRTAASPACSRSGALSEPARPPPPPPHVDA